jgi:hypothetical protein
MLVLETAAEHKSTTNNRHNRSQAPSHTNVE